MRNTRELEGTVCVREIRKPAILKKKTLFSKDACKNKDIQIIFYLDETNEVPKTFLIQCSQSSYELHSGYCIIIVHVLLQTHKIKYLLAFACNECS